MAQMKLCKLRSEDRFGNYKHRDIGFVGMACKHCGGLPGMFELRRLQTKAEVKLFDYITDMLLE